MTATTEAPCGRSARCLAVLAGAADQTLFNVVDGLCSIEMEAPLGQFGSSTASTAGGDQNVPVPDFAQADAPDVPCPYHPRQGAARWSA